MSLLDVICSDPCIATFCLFVWFTYGIIVGRFIVIWGKASDED